MAAPDLEQLFALRNIDLGLDDASRRGDEARARLVESQERFKRTKDEVARDKKAVDDCLKERKLIEIDLKTKEEQVKKYSTQLYEVKTNEQYKALQDEIDRARKESRAIEDRILELMMREDELKARNAQAGKELAEAEKALKEDEEAVARELAEIEKEQEALKARRGEQAAKLASSLVRIYERIRSLRGGSPLAAVGTGADDEAVCSACQLSIRPQLVVEVHKGKELVSCESCGRILYIETEASAAPRNA